jgi:hypothetical protein
MARRLRTKVETESGCVDAIQVVVKREGKEDLVATFGGLSLRWEKFAPAPDYVPAFLYGQADLIQRIEATTHRQKCLFRAFSIGVPYED